MKPTLLIAFALLAVATTAVCQEQTGRRGDTFSWEGNLAAGAWLRIHTVKGNVRVAEAEGSVVQVRAEKRWRRGDPEELHFEVVEDGGNVTICALWQGRSTCSAEGVNTRRGGGSDSDVAADFTVRLPRGVRVRAASGNGEVNVQNAGAEVVATSGNGDVRVATAAGQVRASTGNGRVEVTDADGPVVASSGNGAVRVSTARGPVNATTGNGSIEVRMLTLSGSEDMEFRTGNGSIRIALPADFEGVLEASSGNGRVDSDFPVLTQGRLDGPRLQGTIGSGGRRIRMSSGNGNLELRRLQ